MSELDITHAPKTGGGGKADPRDFKKQLRGSREHRQKFPILKQIFPP